MICSTTLRQRLRLFTKRLSRRATIYQKTFKEGHWDPFAVMHTTGSTGISKPITVRRGTMLKVIPLAKWVQLVADEKKVEANPAGKLRDTYRGWLAAEEAGVPEASLSVTRTKSFSKAVRDMHAVSPQPMKHRCSQWYS